MSDPAISVVIPAFNARATIADTLDAFRAQIADVPYEVVVVDSSSDGTGDVVARDYPEVHLLRSAHRLFPGAARNRGVDVARGDLLAFTDADCTAAPDFIQRVHDAHRHAYPVIGGAIVNANPESFIGWGHYFAEFSQWMPQPRPMAVEIPAGCLSMKRWAFERYGPFLEDTYCSDTAFYWRLRRDGHTSWFDPRIRVAHRNITSLTRLLRKQIWHGRAFARVRVREQAMSIHRRALYVAGAPVLPLVLGFRTVRRVFSTRTYREPFVRTSPLVLVSLAAWSCGEALGYAAGSLPTGEA